jgi:hypothetical protein
MRLIDAIDEWSGVYPSRLDEGPVIPKVWRHFQIHQRREDERFTDDPVSARIETDRVSDVTTGEMRGFHETN